MIFRRPERFRKAFHSLPANIQAKAIKANVDNHDECLKNP